MSSIQHLHIARHTPVKAEVTMESPLHESNNVGEGAHSPDYHLIGRMKATHQS